MTLRDLADNVQPETETTMPFLRGATLQGLKKINQTFRIDSGTGVAYLYANVSLLTDHLDAHRRIPGSVVDCIGDEVPKQLLNPSAVPATVAVADDI